MGRDWDALAAGLGGGDARSRGDAFAALVGAGPEAAPALGRCLGSPDAGVRACAALALANRRDAGRLGEILALEADPEPQVRECVAGAAGYMGGPGAAGALGRLLADPHIGVRKCAARAALRSGARPPIPEGAGGDAEMDGLLDELRAAGEGPRA